MNIINKIAIVILAYADFESLEISLAMHCKYNSHNVDIFILQNGRGTYDCERTYRVAKRYETLYPKQIKVVDWIKPQKAYYSIKELLNSKLMNRYEYICKIDDDTFPLTESWLNDLCKCYEDSYSKYKENLAYVTGLVNNNSWGFARLIKIMGIENEYFKEYSRYHYVGEKNYYSGIGNNLRLLDNTKISDAGCGTIWGNAYIARWIHKKTTLNHLEYIKRTSDKGYEEIDNVKRYSINCILFKKEFWNNIYNNEFNDDDEHSCLLYCYKNNKKIICNLEVPFVHLLYFTQREENKDLIPIIRDYYSKVINAPYPISICVDKEQENENRLRFLESIIGKNNIVQMENNRNILDFIFSITENDRYKIITIFGIRITIKKNNNL